MATIFPIWKVPANGCWLGSQGLLYCFRQLDCRLSPILCRAYQMCARLFAGIKSLSPFLILNASYHASISGRAAFTRAMLGECGSTVMRYSKYSGLALPAHTRAHERKKRCSGVKPSKVFNGFFFILFCKARKAIFKPPLSPMFSPNVS